MDTNQNWLTVREVATELQVHEETVRRWIRSGELPAIELGGPRTMYRIRPAALGSFMRQRTHGRDTAAIAEIPSHPTPPTANFRHLVDHLPMVTFVFDPEGRSSRGSLLYISPEVEQVLGVPADEWYRDLDKVWPTLLTPDQYERIINISERMRATRQHYSLDIRMHNRRTGEPVWVSLDMELDNADASGKPLWYGVLVDITDRKRLEEHLHGHVHTLHGLAARLVSATSVEDMVFEVLRELPRALPAQRARLRVVGTGGRMLTTYALDWERARTPARVDMTVERGALPRNSLVRHVVDSGSFVRIASLERERRFTDERELLGAGLCSALAVPLRERERVIGALETFAPEEEAYLVSDRAFLEATSSIATLALSRQGERWLTVPEVAELLDVQPETVRRWIRQGELVAAMPGGVRAGYRVDASQLDAFIASRSGRRPVG